jgi:predicted CopG family antitoxin
MYMAKNVALSNVAYGKLERMKREGESFSDVVNRLTEEKKPSWRDSFGAWKDDEEMDKIFGKILRDRHKISKRRVVKW